MDVKIYDKLAKKYDLVTKIVSFGIEEIWRWIFIKTIKKYIKNGVLLDIASATGEMGKLNFKKMYFVEPSSEMVKVMLEKFKKNGFIEIEKFKLKKQKQEIIIIQSRAENFEIDEKVDLITAFMALRNFDNLKEGIRNLDRVLKNRGYFAIVEMIKSDNFFSKLILWYMNNIIPFVMGFLGLREEYKLLGKSIDSLKEKDIMELFKGYEIVEKRNLFFIAKMFIMRKNEKND